MESVSSFYKQENDLVYIAGRIEGRKEGWQEGKEEGRKEGREEARQEAREEKYVIFVKNLLTRTDFTNEKIAQEADVTVAFVEKIRASLS